VVGNLALQKISILQMHMLRCMTLQDACLFIELNTRCFV